MTDTSRMSTASTAHAERIKDAPAGATNTPRGLTHSSGTSREGLGVKPTRDLATIVSDSLRVAA